MRHSSAVFLFGTCLWAWGCQSDLGAGDRLGKRGAESVSPPAAQSLVVAGGARVPAKIQGHPISIKRSPIVERTTQPFRHALVYKPDDKTTTGEQRQFAALLVQEAPEGAGPVTEELRIGAVGTDASGGLVVDTQRPTVYTTESHVILNDAYCQQRVHVWAYPALNGQGAVWRGVRATYGANQFPLVWEVLGSEDQPAVLFVCTTIENAAQKEHGKALPGRESSLERSLDEQPGVIVARVLPPGADPAGPMVYLDGTANTINTLLCRCMPAQVGHLADGPRYEILPFEILGDVQIAADGPFRLVKGATPQVSDGGQPWLARVLRLPKQF